MTLPFLLLFTVFATASWAEIDPARPAPVSPSSIGSGELLVRTSTGYRPLPLLRMDVNIEVRGILVGCQVQQTFHNTSAETIEAVYAFPLPERAAVDAFELVIGERRILGEIHEKQEARQIYEAAKSSGRKAGILEQERPNLFTVSVANINAGETVEVQLHYLEEARLADGDFSIHFPLTFTPRYLPADTESTRDHSRVQPPFRDSGDWDAPRATISVRLQPGWETENIRSSSHPLTITRTGQNDWAIEPTDGDVSGDRDFHVSWTPTPSKEPQSVFFLETREGSESAYGLLMLLPPIGSEARDKDTSTETLFVLDVSGSMDGLSIVQAKSALSKALAQLRPQDGFNILLFNNDTQLYMSQFTLADPESVAKAQRWAGTIQADGGTEILQALRRGLYEIHQSARIRPTDTANPHQRVIFITDGAVGNEVQILKEVAAGLGEVRVHTLGIGSAPNRYLMSKMAELGRGHCEYVSSSADLEERMDRFFGRILRPSFTSVSVDWIGLDPVDVSPTPLPDLYPGQPLYVSARLHRQGAKAPAVRITGQLGEEPFLHEVLATSVVDEYSSIGTRWARARVGYWTDQAILGVEPDTVRKRVVDLAKSFHLMTKYTSFVAVEQRATADEESTTARVPNSLPHGSQLGGRLPQGGLTDVRDRWIAAALLLLGMWLARSSVRRGSLPMFDAGERSE